MIPPADVAALLAAIPNGTGRGSAGGKRYIVTRESFVAARAIKLVAEELGGPDFISLNFYDLTDSARLFPCEMSHAKVIAFLRSYAPEPAFDRGLRGARCGNRGDERRLHPSANGATAGLPTSEQLS